MGSARKPASPGKRHTPTPAATRPISRGGSVTAMTGARVVVVDHHDSYTWNLVHLVAAVTGALPAVVEHDEVGLEDLAGYTHVVLSPGPGNPADPGDFAVGRDVLLAAAVPVLGVCLGMQGLVSVYGGHVGQVAPAHGDTALVEHDGSLLFARDSVPFTAVRYHSLAALALPDVLVETAWCDGEDGRVVMGVAAPREALVGRAVPPRVDPHRARRAAGPQLPGGRVSVDPVRGSRSWPRARTDVLARRRRCPRLVRPPAILGFLRDEDVSLTYDAAAPRVARHQHGRTEVVGDDVFAVLADEVARDGGDPAVAGWVTSATRAGPTCPRTPAAACPTRCGCGARPAVRGAPGSRVVRLRGGAPAHARPDDPAGLRRSVRRGPAGSCGSATPTR